MSLKTACKLTDENNKYNKYRPGAHNKLDMQFPIEPQQRNTDREQTQTTNTYSNKLIEISMVPQTEPGAG